MTPEELNRKIEFIIESQARMAAAQEQDRQDRVEFQEWSNRLSAKLSGIADRQAQLLDHQSRRMDRLDKFYEDWLRQNGEFQRQVLDLQQQALRLLNLILDRLPPAPPNPN
jgi:malate synthase